MALVNIYWYPICTFFDTAEFLPAYTTLQLYGPTGIKSKIENCTLSREDTAVGKREMGGFLCGAGRGGGFFF